MVDAKPWLRLLLELLGHLPPGRLAAVLDDLPGDVQEAVALVQDGLLDDIVVEGALADFDQDRWVLLFAELLRAAHEAEALCCASHYQI